VAILATMLSAAQNGLLVFTAVVCSLFFMAVLNRFWPHDKRRTHNDLIGWQLSVLGTTYAVILGFMLYAVWTSFGAAERNVAREASALVNVYELASGLAPEDAEKLKSLTQRYCEAVLHFEWREMDANVRPQETHAIIQQMWAALMESRAAGQREQLAEDHTLSELDSLAKYRRIRLVDMARRLPGVLWFTLLVGAVVTIASSWMFGAESRTFHAFQVSVLTIVIAITLAAIADINRPFQGTVHVSDFAFRQAQAKMTGN